MNNNRKITIRQVWQSALHSAIRGFAAAVGSGVITVFIWWLQSH